MFYSYRTLALIGLAALAMAAPRAHAAQTSSQKAVRVMRISVVDGDAGADADAWPPSDGCTYNGDPFSGDDDSPACPGGTYETCEKAGTYGGGACYCCPR